MGRPSPDPDDHDRLIRLERDITWIQQNIELQAREYARRLSVLNNEHERAAEVARTYVTQEKYEDHVQTEAGTRSLSIDRLEQRFNEFVTRYESRHEDVLRILTAQEGASTAKRLDDERHFRHTSMITGTIGVIVTLVILLANHVF